MKTAKQMLKMTPDQIMALTETLPERELDAMVEIHVMGNDLIPPRGYALARVGSNHVQSTGLVFQLDNGYAVPMPPAEDLPQPEGTTKINDRYTAYVTEWLLGMHELSPGEAEIAGVEAEIAAIRYAPRAFSTDANLIHEMETEIERRDCDWIYVWELGMLLGSALGRCYTSFDIRHATPKQCCQAALSAFCTGPKTKTGYAR